MVLARRLVFILFSLIFLAGVPFLILYSLGYILRPGPITEFIKTGVIYLATVPSGSGVWIDKKRLEQKTPILVRGLVSDSYQVEIRHKGYHAWTRTVTVEAGKAAVLGKILLRPIVEKVEILSEASYQNLIAVEKTNYLLLQQGNSLKDLKIYDRSESRLWALISETHRLAEAKIRQIWTSTESHFLLVHTDQKERDAFLWIRISEKDLSIEPVGDLFLENPDEVHWKGGQARYLFAWSNVKLSRIDIEAREVKPLFETGVKGFGMKESNIFILKDPPRLIQNNEEGSQEKLLSEDAAVMTRLFQSIPKVRILPFSKDLVMFLGHNGQLVSNLLPYEFASGDITFVHENQKHEKILVGGNARLGLIDFSETSRRESFFETGPKVKWLLLNGRSFRQVFWVYDESHVLILDKNDVYVMDVQNLEFFEPVPPGEPRMRVRGDAGVFYDENSGRLFYLNHESGYLMSLEILPRDKLEFFPMPDFKELLDTQENAQK